MTFANTLKPHVGKTIQFNLDGNRFLEAKVLEVHDDHLLYESKLGRKHRLQISKIVDYQEP